MKSDDHSCASLGTWQVSGAEIEEKQQKSSLFPCLSFSQPPHPRLTSLRPLPFITSPLSILVQVPPSLVPLSKTSLSNVELLAWSSLVSHLPSSYPYFTLQGKLFKTLLPLALAEIIVGTCSSYEIFVSFMYLSFFRSK